MADGDSRLRFLIAGAADPLAGDGANVVSNLRRTPKRISAVYVYDAQGTAWFERQCRTPEYYLRRVETSLLEAHAPAIVEYCEGAPLVELGAGTAAKTRLLIDAYDRRGWPCDYFPIDVDSATLRATAQGLVSRYPGLRVHALAATYRISLQALPPCDRPRLFAFLGSSLANLEMTEIDELLTDLFRAGRAGDHLLLGMDLDKDPAVIDRAYNDAAGYGARSTLNMLSHLNRRYAADFVMARFRYRSRYDASRRRNDVRIESLAAQTVTFRSLGAAVALEQGEMIDAEVMWKFAPDQLDELVGRAGFIPQARWLNPVLPYGLFLFRRR